MVLLGCDAWPKRNVLDMCELGDLAVPAGSVRDVNYSSSFDYALLKQCSAQDDMDSFVVVLEVKMRAFISVGKHIARFG